MKCPAITVSGSSPISNPATPSLSHASLARFQSSSALSVTPGPFHAIPPFSKAHAERVRRRMAETTARLVESVLPRPPARQWLLPLPSALRSRLPFDAGLTQAVLSIFVRALFASLRRRARTRRPMQAPQCGAVTFSSSASATR